MDLTLPRNPSPPLLPTANEARATQVNFYSLFSEVHDVQIKLFHRLIEIELQICSKIELVCGCHRCQLEVTGIGDTCNVGEQKSNCCELQATAVGDA
jgi:hypothetical protein